MIIAVVFVGMVCGFASGGALRFGFDYGWIATICGFYGGAFLGVALTALRIATLRDTRDHAKAPLNAPERGIARIG